MGKRVSQVPVCKKDVPIALKFQFQKVREKNLAVSRAVKNRDSSKQCVILGGGLLLVELHCV